MLLSVHQYYYYYPQNSAIALNHFGILESTFQSIYRTWRSVLFLWWHLILEGKKKGIPQFDSFIDFVIYWKPAMSSKTKDSSRCHVRITEAPFLGLCGYSPRKWWWHLLRVWVPTRRSVESPPKARGEGQGQMQSWEVEKLRGLN